MKFPCCPMMLAVICVLPHARGQAPFEDATSALGLSGLSGGVAAWVDFDQDGWVDLYVAGQLWRNRDGQRFERVENEPAGGPGIWGDFNNDGFPDLFCWSGEGKVYRNERGRDFKLEKEALPPLPTQVSLGAAWGDWNGDGFLDLYVGGYEVWPAKEFPDVIYLNENGVRFREAWRQKTIRRARGITVADYDEDGDLDIYVSNYRLQPNLLWKNDGRGTFRDVARAQGVAGIGDLGAWGHTIGSAWGDFDNDGHLDLFVGNFSHPPAYQDRPQFLRNLGPESGFRFSDMSPKAGLRWQESYASPALADFDNDGLLDLYFTTVYPGDFAVLYRNVGQWRFEEVTKQMKVVADRTYQAAWADFDQDGDMDLVTGGKLYRNPGSPHHWIEVRLVGRQSVNGTAIGSVVRMERGNQTLVRQVSSATGQGNQNDATLHFGLGTAASPVTLKIRWPNGREQELRTDVDRVVTVRYESS